MSLPESKCSADLFLGLRFFVPARALPFRSPLLAHSITQLEDLDPANRHVRDKIRQQLQVLRNLGFVEFLGGGGTDKNRCRVSGVRRTEARDRV
jgi:hypothetical protein